MSNPAPCTINQQLVDRITRQATGVVAVRVATGDCIQTLTQQIRDGMPDLATLAAVVDARDESRGEREAVIRRFHKHCPAVGTAVWLVELHDQRLAA